MNDLEKHTSQEHIMDNEIKKTLIAFQEEEIHLKNEIKGNKENVDREKKEKKFL